MEGGETVEQTGIVCGCMIFMRERAADRWREVTRGSAVGTGTLCSPLRMPADKMGKKDMSWLGWNKIFHKHGCLD